MATRNGQSSAHAMHFTGIATDLYRFTHHAVKSVTIIELVSSQCVVIVLMDLHVQVAI